MLKTKDSSFIHFKFIKVEAAHLCYIVSGNWEDESRFLLIGGDHHQQPRMLADPDSIQKTFVFEYIQQTTRDTTYYLPHLNVMIPLFYVYFNFLFFIFYFLFFIFYFILLFYFILFYFYFYYYP